jgi:hypothetical protein
MSRCSIGRKTTSTIYLGLKSSKPKSHQAKAATDSLGLKYHHSRPTARHPRLPPTHRSRDQLIRRTPESRNYQDGENAVAVSPFGVPQPMHSTSWESDLLLAEEDKRKRAPESACALGLSGSCADDSLSFGDEYSAMMLPVLGVIVGIGIGPALEGRREFAFFLSACRLAG